MSKEIRTYCDGPTCTHTYSGSSYMNSSWIQIQIRRNTTIRDIENPKTFDFCSVQCLYHFTEKLLHTENSK